MSRSIAYDVLQILFVMGVAPLYAGVLSRLKEIVQSRRGPSILTEASGSSSRRTRWSRRSRPGSSASPPTSSS